MIDQKEVTFLSILGFYKKNEKWMEKIYLRIEESAKEGRFNIQLTQVELNEMRGTLFSCERFFEEQGFSFDFISTIPSSPWSGITISW